MRASFLTSTRRITVTLMVAVAFFFLPSCYTKNDLKKSYDQGFADCDAECLELQKRVKKYIAELEAKNKVLRKFNQIDDQNNLWNDDNLEGWDAVPPEGFDSWAK